jgi:predicted DNA-binding transcriptional regulator YafY
MRKVIERLLNLLAFLLTTDRPVTADEIRRTVAGYEQSSDEAFRRMFERDKDLLRQMGVPLERRPTDAWEVEFGYVIPSEDYEMPDPHLTDEERAALWLAAQVVRLGGQPSGPDAVFKLGGSPMSGAGEPLAADLGLAADILGDLFAAVDERRRVTFTYRDRKRRIDPYGLVHQRGHWYVVGHDGDAGEVRSYRVDRATDMKQADETGMFERPPGFSVRAALPSAPWEAGQDDLMATVRFDDDVAWYARRQVPADAQIRDVDGGFEARLRVANIEAFLGWIIGFEASAEIIGPSEIRQAMVERVRSVA